MGANNPLKPKDNGKIGLPKITAGQNKLPPVRRGGGRGAKDDEADAFLGLGDGDGAETAKLMGRIRRRMELCIQNEAVNRRDALDDLKFKSGEQWPSDIAAQRNWDKRPCLTINKFPTLIHQITNAQRENRPAINVSPIGDRTDPEVALMLKGMIRSIERDSKADDAYDTAFDGAVSNGFGYWRVVTEFEAPESFNQVARIKRIRNPFTVYLDPNSQDSVGSDSKYGFITELLPKDEYKAEYPDADPMDFDQAGVGESLKNWVGTDTIRVAEYFEIVETKRTLVALSNGWTGWKDELSADAKAMIADGTMEVLRERESMEPRIDWYKVNALEVLDEKAWIGDWIPIIRVPGDEIDIEGKVRFYGVIRHAKDSQRMYNYWKCLATDTPIATATGWTTIDLIEKGETVFSETGEPCSVIGTSPVHVDHECYRVTLDDGSSLVADAEHLWSIVDRGKRVSAGYRYSRAMVQTKDLVPDRHHIDLTRPLEMPTAPLPIHPYALGVWLGDGTTAEPQISGASADLMEIAHHLNDAGCSLGPIRKGRTCNIVSLLGVRKKFTDAGLLGHKHIPDAYLRGSVDQRLALLQGLMDTDGNITPTAQCSFTTTSERIAAGIHELLRSLGIKATFCKRDRPAGKVIGGRVTKTAKPVYQFSFAAYSDMPVFRLARKTARLKRPADGRLPDRRNRTKRFKIKSVERVASVPVKCIMVDSPSHLFLAGRSMVPTHNTSETELIALAPKAPWIVEEGQIEGHESEWKQANTKSYPYLSYKGTNVNGIPVPPPQRQQFAQIPAGVVNAAVGAGQDMMATTGIRFDGSPNERMIDESGRAINELRRTGDIGAFHYTDNLGRALMHTGEILLDLIRKIYDTPRVITILREDDSEEQVEIDPTHPKAIGERRMANGKVRKIFNPVIGKYGVTVTIGPSFATKRIEAASSMMEFVRALPNTASLIADLIAKNMDWEGADEMAKRLAKAVPPQYLTPDIKDIPPQVQAMMQNMDQQIKMLTGELQKAMGALNDKQQDRALEMQKINQDFEAKLIKVVSDVETKMAATQERATANFNTHIGAQLRELGGNVHDLMTALNSSAPKPGAAAAE